MASTEMYLRVVTSRAGGAPDSTVPDLSQCVVISSYRLAWGSERSPSQASACRSSLP